MVGAHLVLQLFFPYFFVEEPSQLPHVPPSVQYHVKYLCPSSRLLTACWLRSQWLYLLHSTQIFLFYMIQLDFKSMFSRLSMFANSGDSCQECMEWQLLTCRYCDNHAFSTNLNWFHIQISEGIICKCNEEGWPIFHTKISEQMSNCSTPENWRGTWKSPLFWKWSSSSKQHPWLWGSSC